MNNAVTYSSHSYSLYPCPPSFSPLCLPHFSYPTFLEVPESQERTLGSEILIKIWLSAMGYDSSGRGCYRESCGLRGFSRGFKSNGLFNVVWLCPLERLVWSYKIGPNWEGVMKGPTAGTGVVRGEHTGTRIHSRGGPFPEELHRSVAPKVRSWNYVNRSPLRCFVSYTVYSLSWPKQSLITTKNCIYIVCWKTQTRTNYKNHTSKELGQSVKCQTLFFTVTSGFDNY